MSGASLQDIHGTAAAAEVDALLIGVVVQVHLVAPHAGVLGNGRTVDNAVIGDDIHLGSQRDDVLVHGHHALADEGAGGGGVIRAAVELAEEKDIVAPDWKVRTPLPSAFLVTFTS